MSRSVWATRRERAAQLLRQAPHAEEILVFYVRLTEIQEGVADRVPVQDWLGTLSATDGSLALVAERLPAPELLTLFDAFLLETTDVGTHVVTSTSRTLLDADPADRLTQLAQPEGFHARAFLEPVMTTLAAAATAGARANQGRRCPRCGSLPVVGVLQDLPAALGARTLACSLCGTGWRVDRLECAYCGETSADSLQLHTADSVPWVRIDECLACRRYIKSIDLRQRGDAVPVVDEIATVELDVWARERGLTKVRTNVLEL